MPLWCGENNHLYPNYDVGAPYATVVRLKQSSLPQL